MRISEIANPRQVILVSAEAEMEVLGKSSLKKNIIALAWHMPLSFEPPMYAICVGKARFSCEMIKKSKCFVVNFMPESAKKEILYCGSNTGMYVDKFRESGLTGLESEKMHCPRIKQSAGWLECEVVEEVEAGDHIIFVGKVIHMALSKGGKDAKRPFHLGGDDFTTTK